MKKRAIVWFLVGLALFAWGRAHSQEQEPPKDAVQCVAMPYVPLTPYEWVGMDTCGQVWKLILPASHRPHPRSATAADSLTGIRTMGENPDPVHPLCVWWNLESGEYRSIPCPEPNSVTGWRPANKELLR